MAFFTYMLASQRNGTLYIGSTEDLIRRVAQRRAPSVGDELDDAHTTSCVGTTSSPTPCRARPTAAAKLCPTASVPPARSITAK